MWELLDRILGYSDPDGEVARRRVLQLSREVEGHLSMVFHRFLGGEIPDRRKLRILLNGQDVRPWDPFARQEKATMALPVAKIPLSEGRITLQPFLLPHQSDFSSAESFRQASGPLSWNQQQGFYIYRAERLIQAGGWCRLRTMDEHTKLARVALHFSPQLDDAFRVNVAKMRALIPAAARPQVSDVLAPVIKLAAERYRRSPASSESASSKDSRDFGRMLNSLLSVARSDERRIIKRVAARLGESWRRAG
jgi:hypothetical protein